MKLYLSRREQYVIAILIIAIIGGMVAVSYAYRNRGRMRTEEPLLSQPVAERSVASTPDTGVLVCVHVTGAVKSPGVYTFSDGQRVQDAIERAGGAKDDGVADALNLAAQLEDGEKIYVPTKAEWEKITQTQGCPPLIETPTKKISARDAAAATSSLPNSSTQPSAQPTLRGPKPLPTEKVSLNTATKEQLMTLPGVGESTAQTIIEYRTQHGGFTDLSQLLDVPRIGAKTLDRLTPYITL